MLLRKRPVLRLLPWVPARVRVDEDEVADVGGDVDKLQKKVHVSWKNGRYPYLMMIEEKKQAVQGI